MEAASYPQGVGPPAVTPDDLGAHPRVVSLPWLVSVGFVLAVLCSGLDAYNVWGIPIPWIGQFVITAAALFTLASGKLTLVPGSTSFLLFFAWAAVCTAVNAAITDYSALMPTLATMPYRIFIGLRFFQLIAFAATLYVTYWLLKRRSEALVIRILVGIGSGIALLAIYIYVAQLAGLPEPPRTRMGTTGGAQATVFSYAFHRALGTFREPGQLAAWLTVPIMLAFAWKRRIGNAAGLLMTMVLLLTGSLSGILGAAIGFVTALLVTGQPWGTRLKSLVGVAAVVGLAAVGFNSLVREDVSLVTVLGNRIGQISDSGMLGSSRGRIYQALGDLPLEAMGVGLGHSNLLLARTMGSNAVSSYSSLYLGTAYSLGLPGFALLAWFLAAPLVGGIRRLRRLRGGGAPFWIFAGYLTWLVMFGFRSEELPFMFAVVTALLLNSLGRRHQPPPGSPRGA